MITLINTGKRFLWRFAVLVALSSSDLAGAEPPATASPANGPKEEMLTWIDRERKLRHIPGVGFALVEKGKVTHAGGVGSADLGHRRDVTADTVFRVGSVSKPFAATALLHLIEETDLTLHSDIRSLLTELPLSPQLDIPLTPHHLLTHTCGLNERLFGQHARSPDDFRSLASYLKEHLPPRFGAPGHVISYNDYCTSLAGYLVEKVSGKTFHDYVATHIFGPLGMTASTFDQLAGAPDFDGRLASSYRWQDGVHYPYPRDYIMTTPAAGLFTTPSDMSKYLLFLLGKGADVLTEVSLAKQKSVQFTHHEKLSGRAYGFASMRFRGRAVFYKDGQAMGFSARLVLVPETGDGFFIVQNRSIFDAMGAVNDAGRFNRHLTMVFLESLFVQEETKSASVPPPPTGDDMSPYTGTYRNVVAARHTFEKIITLMDDITVSSPEPGVIQFGSQKYVHIGNDVFQWHEGDPFYIVFDKVPGGTADHLFIGGGAYERVPAWSNSSTAPLILSALLAATLLVLLVNLWPAVRSGVAQGPARKMVFSSTLKIAGVAGIGALFVVTDLQQFFFGPPPLLTVLLALPVLAFAVDAWILVTALSAFRRSGTMMRVSLVLHITASLLLLWWFDDWNLLGWRYG